MSPGNPAGPVPGAEPVSRFRAWIGSIAARISLLRVLGILVAIVLLLSGVLCAGVMRTLARLEGAQEYWQKLDVPQHVERYRWSDWQRGSGGLAPPPRDDLAGATIEAHRYARRQTLFKDYLFCEARYLLKDGSARVAYARCPAPHVTLRPHRAEMAAAAMAAAGLVVLLATIFWPRRRASPGAAGPPGAQRVD